MERFIGIDIGGTNIKCGVVDSFGNLDMTSSTKTAARQEEILEQAEGLIGELLRALKDAGDIKAVGVAVPGAVDVKNGVALGAVNLPWDKLPIAPLLSKRFNLPVKLEKDTDAGALGELLYGKGKGLKNLFYIALGTGVGGGMIVEGNLYRGIGGAGEIGHIIVMPDGPMCKCGTRGCLEAVASASSIVKAAAGTGSSEFTNTAQVFKAAADGDPAAKSALKRAGLGLAAAIICVYRLTAPEVIIIGGGVSKAGPPLLELIKDGLSSLTKSWSNCPIVLSDTADWSGVLGAAAAGRLKYESFD